MPLYAGVCSADITPPPGVWMAGYAFRATGAMGVHDTLNATAFVIDNGVVRVAIISVDLIALPADIITRIRSEIAQTIGTSVSAIMLHCTHTHGGPYVGIYRAMGSRFPAYEEILCRKIVGVCSGAVERFLPARLTYGEAPAQIGVNRRQRVDGRIEIGRNLSGPVVPIVQTLSVTSIDGSTFAILFAHTCHPTTLGGENLYLTAEWPGAAVRHLTQRCKEEGASNGYSADCCAIALVGCCGDINPLHRGTWETMEANGKTVADAAHTARWGSHGHLDANLKYQELQLKLPTLPPIPLDEARKELDHWTDQLNRHLTSGANEGALMFDRARIEWALDQLTRNEPGKDAGEVDFSIQCLDLGGVKIIGFPAEMFSSYQLDLIQQSTKPVFALSYTNGCANYLPAAADYPSGGYEVEDAYKYYASPMFAPEAELLVREAAYRLLDVDDPDTTPLPAST